MASDFNYKKYSLENLENWMHDAMSCAEATPQEIYNVIKGVVEENYYTYKNQASQAYELLALLNGNGKGHLSCDKDDPSPECKGAWTSFWEETHYSEEYKGSSVSSVSDVMPPWGHSDMEALRYTEEELNAMCDKAASDQEKEKCREYNLREAEYYDKRAKLDADYEKVKRWVLPTEVDSLTGDVIVNLPDDLLEAANLKEGDQVEWIDNGEGSYIMKKVTQPLKMNEC